MLHAVQILSYYPRLDVNLCIGLFRDEKKVCQFLRNCETMTTADQVKKLERKKVTENNLGKSLSCDTPIKKSSNNFN